MLTISRCSEIKYHGSLALFQGLQASKIGTLCGSRTHASNLEGSRAAVTLIALLKMAPTVGSDPTTFELTARCTTNCATWDLKIDMSIAFRHTTHSGLELSTDDRSGL